MRTPAAATTSLLFLVVLTVSGIANLKGADSMCGIGAVVAPDAPEGTPTLKAIVLDHINVTEVIPGGPADRSGLQKGDEIIQVNGKSVVGTNFDDVVTKLIRGKEGTPVKITIKRREVPSQLSFSIVREPVTLHSVKH